MKKVIYIIFIIIIMLALNSTNIKAKDEDPGKYLPQVSKSSKEKGATSSSSSSTELKDKAEIKKSAIIYVIGAVIVFAAGALLGAISNLSTNVVKTQG